MRESDGAHKLPTRFIPLGDGLLRYGRVLECVRRPKDLNWREACRGCWLSRGIRDGVPVNCEDIQCSKWDRRDGEDVWFVVRQIVK